MPRPFLIVEVLSPSTETDDRNVKLRDYRRLPSVRDILLLASDRPAIEHYARSGDRCLLADLGPEDTLRLEGLGIELALHGLYVGLSLAKREMPDAGGHKSEVDYKSLLIIFLDNLTVLTLEPRAMRRLASCFAVGLALVLQPAAARADLFEEIRARGLVRIGTVEQLPYFHREGKRLRGFIVDLGNRLARDLNVRAEFKTAKSHNLVERLKSGDVDLVAGGVPITPERAIEIVFSPPISRTPVELVTRAVTLRPIGGPAVPAEPEAVIAVVSGTEAAAAAEAAFPDGRLLRKHSEADVIAALAIGEATVAALGLPWSAMLLDKNPRAFARSAGPLLTLVEAFALSPSEARFAQFMDDWVTAIEADGFLPERRGHWFEGGGWLMPERGGAGPETAAGSPRRKRSKRCAVVKRAPAATGAPARC